MAKIDLKKMKAFTLAELLVVLVVSSLVISLAIVSMDIVKKQIIAMEKILMERNQRRILEKNLWLEMEYGRSTFIESKRHLLIRNESRKRTYLLEDDFIAIDQDTLIKDDELTYTFFYQGDPVKSGSVDAIKIEFSNPAFGNMFIYRLPDALEAMNEL